MVASIGTSHWSGCGIRGRASWLRKLSAAGPSVRGREVRSSSVLAGLSPTNGSRDSSCVQSPERSYRALPMDAEVCEGSPTHAARPTVRRGGDSLEERGSPNPPGSPIQQSPLNESFRKLPKYGGSWEYHVPTYTYPT